MAATGDISAGSQGVNLAQLISAISPVLLGSGKTTGTTGSEGTSGTTSSGGTKTTTSADPNSLAALLSIASGAAGNINNPAATDAVVNDIFRRAVSAFSPTLAGAASTGLYNTTSLSLLRDNSIAEATAAASAAVLNYKTSQQQIAQNALTGVVNATRTSDTTNTAAQNTTTENKGVTSSITAPSVGGSQILQSIAGIGASVIGNKFLGSPFVTRNITDPILNALGLGGPAKAAVPGTNAVATSVTSAVDPSKITVATQSSPGVPGGVSYSLPNASTPSGVSSASTSAPAVDVSNAVTGGTSITPTAASDSAFSVPEPILTESPAASIPANSAVDVASNANAATSANLGSGFAGVGSALQEIVPGSVEAGGSFVAGDAAAIAEAGDIGTGAGLGATASDLAASGSTSLVTNAAAASGEVASGFGNLTGLGGSTGSALFDGLPVIGAAINGVMGIQNDPNGKGGNQAVGGILGTILGAIAGGPLGAGIGGLIGGLGGGMIGPKPPSSYSSTRFGTNPQGALALIDHSYQGKDITLEQENAITQQAAALNTLMKSYGLKVNGDFAGGLPFELGQNTPGGAADPNKFYDFNTPNVGGKTALSKLGFAASGNSQLDAAINGKSFNTVNDLYGALQNSGVNPTTPVSFDNLANDAQGLLRDHYQTQLDYMMKVTGLTEAQLNMGPVAPSGSE